MNNGEHVKIHVLSPCITSIAIAVVDYNGDEASDLKGMGNDSFQSPSTRHMNSSRNHGMN